MASIAARVSIRGLSPAVRQLGYAWIIGSVIMGTVATLFLAFPPTPQVSPGQSIFPLPGQPGASGAAPVAPLAGLPPLVRLGVVTLVITLFIGLAVLAWRTPGISWLPEDVRGRMLWVLLTGGAGIAAWLFAATVTFGAGFGRPAQLVLGYLGGGLPFALVAAMLQRSWRVNVAAGGVSAVLVVAGFLLVAGSEYQPSALSLYFQYIGYLFGGRTGYLPGGPVRLY